MKYRREIDGLRALAVLPVILFHAHLPGFSGGYIGVDIFFVISGYLITTILIAEIENKQFSIVNFYERRLRRILPALALVVLACYSVASILLLPSEFLDFSQSILAVAVFASNILFFIESDYFATASELKPLLHTWSLAIEEQYYLFFPIFLLLFWRFGKAFVLATLGLVFLSSLGLAIWASTHYPSANFYLLPTRVWELLVGSFLAFFVFNKGYFESRSLNEIGGYIGLFAVFYSVVFFDKHTPFPSAYALVPTLGAAFLILFAINGTSVQRLLSSRTLVYIGLISYSLYLWHQPVFAFAKQYAFFEAPSDITMIMLSLITFGLAHVSWKYVETPFRSKHNFDRKKIFLLSAITTVVMVGLGVLGVHSSTSKTTPSFLSNYNIAEYNLDNATLREYSWHPLRELSQSKTYQVDNNPFDETLWFNEQDKRYKILIIGNSHSKDVYNVLSNSKVVNQTFQLARFGQQISRLNEEIFTLSNYQNADVIMIASQYRNDNLKLDWLIDRTEADGKQFVMVKNIAEFESFSIRKLTLADKIIRDSIEQGITNPIEIAHAANQAYTEAVISKDAPPHIAVSNKNIEYLQLRFPEMIVLDRNAYVCDFDLPRCYAIDSQLNKYFYDYSHHTMKGAAFYGQRVDEVKWLDELIMRLKNE